MTSTLHPGLSASSVTLAKRRSIQAVHEWKQDKVVAGRGRAIEKFLVVAGECVPCLFGEDTMRCCS